MQIFEAVFDHLPTLEDEISYKHILRALIGSVQTLGLLLICFQRLDVLIGHMPETGLVLRKMSILDAVFGPLYIC